MKGVANQVLNPDDSQRLAQIQADPQRALQDIISLESKVSNLVTELAKLQEERRLDRARRFGASSEAGDHQANLFDEAELTELTPDEETTEAADTDIEVAAHTKRRPKRKALPSDLDRVDIHHDLSIEDKICGCCGKEMQRIGEKTSEQLDVIPMQVFVRVHHCATYSCSGCDESIKTASKPVQPIPKSIASAGLLAHVATAKYADGLPLYRQTRQYQRLGIELPRNTLAGHMLKVGALVRPLIEALQQHILSYDIVNMDETPVQVLKEPGKVAQSKSYMWVMKGGPPEQTAIIYHYDPGRTQAVPKLLLKDYAGYLQTDGYAGYNGILCENTITGLGCWAHVRRKFMDAKKALPKKDQDRGNKVNQALAFISKLYQLEQRIKNMALENKQHTRQAEAQITLTKFRAWLDKQSVPPKSLLGKAIHYAIAQWPRLTVYTEDGRLNIDNNGVENTIRPFAIGRKNWLFSDTQNGANASANLYSLIETAKANGLNEYAYLKYVFTELPKAEGAKAVTKLLPWNVDPADVDKQLTKPGSTR